MSENFDAEARHRNISCGLYQLSEPLEDKLEEGRLVFFHNHGEPGPGVYPVRKWIRNKAIFAKRGFLLPYPGYEKTLKRLPPEGFYRVEEELTCCEKRCRTFEKGTLVQLGYTARSAPILFIPVWGYRGLTLPERGTRIAIDDLSRLEPVKVIRKFVTDDLEVEPSSVQITGSKYLH